MSGFQEFLAVEFPGDRIEHLSGSNNEVYLVHTQPQPVVAKHVRDVDIPLSYVAEANRILAKHLPVQRIIQVFETRREDPYDAVFAEYVDGIDLATTVSREGVSHPDLAAYFTEFIVACRELPLMHDAFGMFKQEAPAFSTHAEYVVHYGRRYWGRVRPLFAGTPLAETVDTWLDSGFPSALAEHPARYVVVPIDANLKNFVMTPGNRIVVLNLPIAAVSTPAHAVASISTHLRNRELYEQFRERAASTLAGDDDLVRHFELWLLLGILSFYAVREPGQQETWRDWGAPVALLEDFTRLARSLLGGAGES